MRDAGEAPEASDPAPQSGEEEDDDDDIINAEGDDTGEDDQAEDDAESVDTEDEEREEPEVRTFTCSTAVAPGWIDLATTAERCV